MRTGHPARATWPLAALLALVGVLAMHGIGTAGCATSAPPTSQAHAHAHMAKPAAEGVPAASHDRGAHAHPEPAAASTSAETGGGPTVGAGSRADGGHDENCVATVPQRTGVAGAAGGGVVAVLATSVHAVVGWVGQIGRFAGQRRGPPASGVGLLVRLCVSVR